MTLPRSTLSVEEGLLPAVQECMQGLGAVEESD